MPWIHRHSAVLMDTGDMDPAGSTWTPLRPDDVHEEPHTSSLQRHQSAGPGPAFTSFSEAIQLLRTRSSGMGHLSLPPPNDGHQDTPVEASAAAEFDGKTLDIIGSMSGRLRRKLAVKQQRTNTLELKNDQTKQYRTQTLREMFQLIQDEIHEIEKFTTLTAKDQGEIDGSAKKRHKYSGGWLTQRDLRRLETAYAPQEEPVLIVRRHCILFSFDLLRGVILWDRLIVLVPDGADSLLLLLEQNLFQYETEEQIVSAARDMPKTHSKRHSHGFLGGILHHSKARASTNQDTNSRPFEMQTQQNGYKGHRHSLANVEHQPHEASSAGALTDARSRRSKSFTDVSSLMAAHHESPDSNLAKRGLFEMHALEAVLNTVVEIQSHEHDSLYNQVQQRLNILSSSASISVENQEALRNLKNLVSAQEVRVRRCKIVLEEMLEEDEDMALINLTKLRNDPKLYSWPLSQEILGHHSEVELLLEAYLTDYNSVLNKLEVLRNHIQNSEESVMLRLDNVRNQFLLAGTTLALLSTWFTFGATIAGIFGQNLIDNLEYDPFYFNLITSVTAAVIVLAISVGFWILARMWAGRGVW